MARQNTLGEKRKTNKRHSQYVTTNDGEEALFAQTRADALARVSGLARRCSNVAQTKRSAKNHFRVAQQPTTHIHCHVHTLADKCLGARGYGR